MPALLGTDLQLNAAECQGGQGGRPVLAELVKHRLQDAQLHQGRGQVRSAPKTPQTPNPKTQNPNPETQNPELIHSRGAAVGGSFGSLFGVCGALFGVWSFGSLFGVWSVLSVHCLVCVVKL